MLDINVILQKSVAKGASDLHLKVGRPPTLRLHGSLENLEGFPKVTSEDTIKIAQAVMPQALRGSFKENKEADFAYSIPKVGRFRVNTFLQRGVISMVFRTIPVGIPSVDKLNLPDVIKKISMEQRGLVLVTGITGSGKSTTLAAMIDHINENRKCNVITVEDPIEFMHNDKNCIVAQREVGQDTNGFSEALKRALRQDPDVILVGEMRDLETIETAMHAAETGHLVMSTLHTLDAPETINRIISVFPPHQQGQVRLQLAGIIKAVISQRLVPTVDGKGRVAAVEIMVSNGTIRECISDSSKTKQITDFIEQGRSVYGSQSFDQHLQDHVKSGMVTFEEAMKWAKKPDDFALKVKGVSSSSDDDSDWKLGGMTDSEED
ncbi:type IV pilus twitching motility protein PilT [Limisalsivibrio acetivorans]|uniref:type IV pilus twitching motility protein PilT n=1 Tax=Limisalsivibrio acetivorans TaxID=1304888 RepID=UPI0003B48E50|nr:type IV pilus twitching motility protein PilT [Limisalsivibrio acetivorans]